MGEGSLGVAIRGLGLRDIATIASSAILFAAGLVIIARDVLDLGLPFVAAASLGGTAIGAAAGWGDVRSRRSRRHAEHTNAR